MTNLCKHCTYYDEYIYDGKFQPVPICKRHSDLKIAIEAIEKSNEFKIKNKCCEMIGLNLAKKIQQSASAIKAFGDDSKELSDKLKEENNE